MPISEHKPSFLIEAWALYGIGTVVLFTRFFVRLKTVGWRRLQGDDAFSVLALIFYAMDASTVHLIYYFGTNLEASMRTSAIPTSDLSEYVLGSKLQLTAWYSYTALIWSLKGTMLCFFSRITVGTWHNKVVKAVSVGCVLSYVVVFLTITFGCFPTHKNWQVLPDPGAKCTFKKQNFLVTTVLNVLTDACILAIPVPLLWGLQVSLRRKLFIMLLLSSGAFVVAAAIIRVSLTLSSNPSAITINTWGVRETIVGIITVNIPAIWPIFRRGFWNGGPLSNHNTLQAMAGVGRRRTISGAFEIRSINSEGAAGFRTRARSSANASEKSNVGQVKAEPSSAVMVQTTYDIESNRDPGEGSSWGDVRGVTETSISAAGGSPV